MSADLIPFVFEDHEVRVRIEGDEVIFVAADVASILGYGDTAALTRYLEPDEKGLSDWQTLGGAQRLSHVTEAGLYSAIMRATSDAAKPFRRWVTHDVLPTIHRTGAYSITPARELTEDELIHKALTISVARVEALTAKVAELEPKASAWQYTLGAVNDWSVTDASKVLGRDPAIKTGPRKLYAFLLAKGWIFKDKKGKWAARQEQINAGRLTMKATSYTDMHSGEPVIGRSDVRITPRGLEELRRILGGSEISGGLTLVTA